LGSVLPILSLKKTALRATIILGALMVAVPGAQAEPSTKKAIWGPGRVDGVSQFPIYQDLGVGILPFGIYWDRIAKSRPADPHNPDDPAYNWAAYPDVEFSTREAPRYGIQIMLQVARTPGWANGDQPNTVPPKRARDYANFMIAVSRRYPNVRYFSVWGEPIRASNFLLHPTESRNYFARDSDRLQEAPKPFNYRQRKDVRHYAELVDATYGALKKENAGDLIIGGNTTTSGSVDPFNWIRFMRLRNGKPPRMDLYGHNPFGTRGPDLKKKQLVPGTADFSDLDILVPHIDRWLGRSGRNHKLKLFLSEFTAPTEVPSRDFPFYVTPSVQAKWVRDALRIGRSWSRIATVGWYKLYDSEPDGEGRESRLGLITRAGRRRASYTAFKQG